MKAKAFAIAAILMGWIMEANAMEEWFQTWNRPEYQEWALPIPEGYLLHILRKEEEGYLVVQAKLVMGDSGLPGFEVIAGQTVASEELAMQRIGLWEAERTASDN